MEGIPVIHAAIGRDREPSPTAFVILCFLIKWVNANARVSVLMALPVIWLCSESLNLKKWRLCSCINSQALLLFLTENNTWCPIFASASAIGIAAGI